MAVGHCEEPFFDMARATSRFERETEVWREIKFDETRFLSGKEQNMITIEYVERYREKFVENFSEIQLHIKA